MYSIDSIDHVVNLDPSRVNVLNQNQNFWDDLVLGCLL
jgi:hypothetical protein